MDRPDRTREAAASQKPALMTWNRDADPAVSEYASPRILRVGDTICSAPARALCLVHPRHLYPVSTGTNDATGAMSNTYDEPAMTMPEHSSWRSYTSVLQSAVGWA